MSTQYDRDTSMEAYVDSVERLSAHVRSLFTGRLPRDSVACVVEAFSAAVGGDIAKADELIKRARTLSVAEGVSDPVRLVEVPTGR